MTIQIDNGDILIGQVDSDFYEVAKSWNMMRWSKKDRALRGKLSLPLLNKIASVRTLPPKFEELRQRLAKKQAAIDEERENLDPEPILKYPVKASLFKHQIRGANMAMLTFDYDTDKKAFPDRGGDSKKWPHLGFGHLYEMGCGKSLTAIACMGALYTHGKIDRVLIVAPTSVIGVWPKELAQFADFKFSVALMLGTKQQRLDALKAVTPEHYLFKPLQVAVINYESVWRDGIYEALAAWKPDMIIADESQRIKTHDAAQSKAMHKLGDIAYYKMILSGTPVQNNAIDIFSQYRFLDSSVFGTNFYAFKNKYAVMGGFQQHQIVGYRDMEDLIQKEHSIAYRITKAEALDLPEQTFENRYIILPPSDRKLYDELRRESYAELSNGDSVTATTVLTKLLRLQQLTGGFLKMDEQDEPKRINTAKLDALMEIISDCQDAGQKVVVFARFTSEIDMICEAMNKANVTYGMIDGRTPMEHKTDRTTGKEYLSRAEIVNEFQTNPKITVFLAQIQTAGLGITLHAASIAVFYSMDFNYASYTQATARIHRIGQRHPCTYIHLVCQDTVDEKVLQAIQHKDDLAKSVVDNWRAYFK